MKKVFVDTNILVDLIADRKPYSKFAIELFSRAESGSIKLYASSHSIATTYYLLKKYLDEKKLREVIYHLTDFLNIVPVDADILRKSLKSKHKDFEDGIQILAASTIPKIDCIVTRNIRDYKDSNIPVYAPDEVMIKI